LSLFDLIASLYSLFFVE